MAARLVAAALAVALCTGAHAFVLPAERLMISTSAPLYSSRGQAPLQAASVSGSRPSAQSYSRMPSLLLGSLLAGAALLRRQQRSVERRITMQDIESLTVADIPQNWRPKVSIGLARRSQITQGIKQQLDKTFFIMAFNNFGMTIPQQEEARAMFPDTVKVRVLKNALVRKAMTGTPWEAFTPKMKGNNMYIFVESDKDLKDSVKAYLQVVKKLGREDVINKMKEAAGSDLTYDLKPCIGGIMADEWNVIDADDIPKYKDFPTKSELIAQIAGSIKQVTTKVAKGIKQVPQKMAIGIKKTVEKGEEDGKSTVGDVVA
eukprot:TRINITY_DN2945_c0_g1_i2.p1 TRINITY_DN2945_c0_g1~~TRINITY_DN2945_c0_g1_i2.p1  ORF type:complete len:341 (-),score=105.94 TRINITY_DN2945_c0_g1_i2:38-988(-)